MAAKIDLNPVGNFDVSGDRLGQSWTRWLRGFELYATGKGVDDKKQKKALLLHCAGLDVQDIYFTLTEEDGDDDFDKTIKTLKKHFDAKVNFSVERYNLRSIKQNETETIDQYITRLKQQVVLCDHADPDAQVRDQVIEKCRSNKLRTRLLEKGPGLTLDDRCISKYDFSALWENLKIQKIVCKSEKSEKKLYAYGSETPLEVLGKFTCEINVKGQSESVEGAFYVVKGNSVSLLDALSRLVAINKTEFKERNVAEEFVRFCAQEGTPKALTTQEIEKEAKVDTELSEVRNCLQQAKWNQSVMSAYYPVKNELSVIGYLVMRGKRFIILSKHYKPNACN
ncbi:unnamed protein product [Mytilus edulis]|uniref:Retrotransposon gag domain-containing protein n=1 Tax=Mytilus edulis TaxID=6550 RepID=A0A8S3PYV8_MYTED|nr:unnamed protein product [Mytilus edulis]